jgi:DNA mismatch repair protein MutS
MVSNNAQTPAMRQYLAAKAQHPDALLFFRMGDFYELFFQDAVEAAQLLELTLTSRNKSDPDPVPMAGVPYHAAPGYIQKLVDAGKKVAVCDQMEDPALARGVVRREVTRVVSPGVQLDSEGLDSRAPNYLLAIEEGLHGFGLAYTDVTTGESWTALARDVAALQSELARLEPRELVVDAAFLHKHRKWVERLPRASITVRDREFFDVRRARERLQRWSGSQDLPPEQASALGAILAYLDANCPQAVAGLHAPVAYDLTTTMILEESTLANLEILKTLMGGQRKGSLLGLLDKTHTAMGARLLRRWLQYPLLDPALINRRLDLVEALLQQAVARAELRGLLSSVYDMERLCGRVQSGVAGPRDLAALRASLERVAPIRALLAGLEGPVLRRFAMEIEPPEDVLADLQATLTDAPPVLLRDGGVIREGVSAELDETIALSRGGKDWLVQYEAEQRKLTGIASLKVSFTRVFGYYIEVSKPNLHLVPTSYFRKQTVATGERFFTEELKTYEEKILTADERRARLEAELYDALRGRVAARAEHIDRVAGVLAQVDCLAALAQVAHERRYCRPSVDNSRGLSIEAGRHPVVEAMLEDEAFVPNDVELDGDNARLLLITGPNMAGKSTVMRQVALTVLLAQVGSFVPASRARVGVVDRIFTRVGASDNLSKGQSTFMVEMTETSHILKRATPRSLVVVDEIGRGTSTFDGVSIAWAVAEHLCDQSQARTLFATHYHELTELAQIRPMIRNFHIAVKEWNDEIVFLRKLVPGGTNRSYGIQVGRLAGLPPTVIQRAKEVLAGLENGHLVISASPHNKGGGRRERSAGQLDLFAAQPAAALHPALEALHEIEPDALAPIEALNALYRLKKLSRDEGAKGDQTNV